MSSEAKEALKECLSAMEMQEGREKEELHITQEVALDIWNKAKKIAQNALGVLETQDREAAEKELIEIMESSLAPRPQDFDDVGRGYWLCPGMDKQTDGGYLPGANGHPHAARYESVKANANLISSECKDGLHRPVLDFDIPVRYVPSTTPGHGHLYIDQPLEWEEYKKLLQVMEEVGLLETGYVNASIDRKATFVRPEWVKKPTKDES